jgi:hypothetical protein
MTITGSSGSNVGCVCLSVNAVSWNYVLMCVSLKWYSSVGCQQWCVALTL